MIIIVDIYSCFYRSFSYVYVYIYIFRDYNLFLSNFLEVLNIIYNYRGCIIYVY